MIWAAASLGVLGEAAGLLGGLGAGALGVEAGALGQVAHLVEPRLGLAHLLRELVLGGAPATGQRGLEVGSRLRRPRPLLLVDGLGLLQPDRGVALGAVAVLVGGLAGVLHDPGRLGVGLAVHAGGVAVGLLADPRGLLVGVRAVRVDLLLRLGAQLERLALGQAEDLADPGPEVLVARRLGGRAGRVVQLLDPRSEPVALVRQLGDGRGELLEPASRPRQGRSHA